MKKYLLITLALLLSLIGKAEQIQEGAWIINLDPSTKLLAITYNGKTILKDAYATANSAFSNGVLTTKKSNDTLTVSFTHEDVTDCFGSGKRHDIIYRFSDVMVMTQSFAFYHQHQGQYHDFS